MPDIDLINRTARIRDARFAAILPALQAQITEDFAPRWGIAPVALHLVGRAAQPDPTHWKVWLLNTSDTPGDLGYHEDDPGLPEAKIFCDDDMRYGSEISVTVSHELLEMLADPTVDRWGPTIGSDRFITEVCLAGETIIPMTDGSAPPIGLLAARGSLDARRTMREAETVAVIFTDGTIVRCTPNHRFLLTDGRFIEAASLRSGDMLPRSTLADGVNRTDVYAVHGRHDAGDLVAGSDGDNIGLGEFATADRLTMQVAIPSHAAFRRCVEHIFSVRAEEQVRGIDTGGRVTGMTNFDARRNLSFMQTKRKNVRIEDAPFFPKLPVPGTACGSDPKPTTVERGGALNVGPESVLQRRGAVVIGNETGIQIAMPSLPRPMRGAETLRANRPLTSFDGAFHAKVIDRVERAGKCDVYDLTVPKHHNFAVGADVFVHNCDPVEADDDGYLKLGVRVSNFVLPSYYRPGTPAPWDFRNLLTGPCPALRPGGYAMFLNVASNSWSTTAARYADGSLSHRAFKPLGRSARRAAKGP